MLRRVSLQNQSLRYHRPMTVWPALVFGVILSIVPPTAPAEEGNCSRHDDSSRPDCYRAVAFLQRFQLALRNNDKAAITPLVRFPLRASLHGKEVWIKNPDQLLAHYGQIFNAQVRCAVLSARSNEVWGNWQGFMVARGTIWFDEDVPSHAKAGVNAPDFWTKYPFKVITVTPGPGDDKCEGK